MIRDAMTLVVAMTIAAAMFAAGCSDELRNGPDQCLRAELFQQCLSAVPAGPESTKYNDWSEVVSGCESASYYQSLRSRALIAEECRS